MCNLKKLIKSVYHTNQTKKLKKEQNKKNDELIKSGNGSKIREICPQKWGRLRWEGFMEKGKFWVCSGREKDWCIVSFDKI